VSSYEEVELIVPATFCLDHGGDRVKQLVIGPTASFTASGMAILLFLLLRLPAASLWSAFGRARTMRTKFSFQADRAFIRQAREQREIRCVESATPPPLAIDLPTLALEPPRPSCRLE
jgi:hypothetical protein